MTLNHYKECLDSIDEIAVIGRESVIGGVVCNVAGLMRRGTVANLVLVTYDAEYRDLTEASEIEELTGRKRKRTHRAELKENIKFTKKSICDNVEKIIIGGKEFTAAMSSSSLLTGTEDIIAMCEFIKKGWHPQSLGCYNTENLYVESIELTEEIDSLADLDTSRLEIINRRGVEEIIIEKKIKLTVGDQNKKVTVKNKSTGETYTAFINSVEMFDPWESTKKLLSDPEYLKHISEDALPQIRKEIEEANGNLCPRGMRLPVVEYECEDISLQFYLKEYLDSELVYAGDGPTSILLMHSDKELGKHGLKVKCSCIQSPLPSDTSEISAEIFSGNISTEAGTYIL